MAEGGSALVGLGVKAYESTVGGSVKGVDSEPLPGMFDGRVEFALLSKEGNRPFEGEGVQAVEAVAFKKLPVVKFGRVAQGESGHVIALVEGNGSLEGGETAITGFGCKVAVMMLVLDGGFEGA